MKDRILLIRILAVMAGLLGGVLSARADGVLSRHVDFELLNSFVTLPEGLEVMGESEYRKRVEKNDPELARVRERFSQMFASMGVARMSRAEVKQVESEKKEKLGIKALHLIEQLTFERMAYAISRARGDSSWCGEVWKTFHVLYLISTEDKSGLGIESADLALYLNYVLHGAKMFAMPCRDDVDKDNAVVARLIGRSGVKDVKFLNGSPKKKQHKHPFPIVMDPSSGSMRVRAFEPDDKKPEDFSSDTIIVMMPDLLWDEFKAPSYFRVLWGGKRIKGRETDAGALEKKWVGRWGQ